MAVWTAPQRSCHAATAAVMEAPAGHDPSNGDLTEKLIRLYRVVGAPVKAARAFCKSWAPGHRPGAYGQMVLGPDGRNLGW